jgi:hypothetical protein
MKVSRQQLWPVIGLLLALAVAVGFIARALGRRDPQAPAAANSVATEPVTTPSSDALPPLPTPMKDPFLAQVPAESAAAADDGDADSNPDEMAPDGGSDGSSHSGAGPNRAPARPMLAGVVTGAKTVAAIRIGERRYYVGVGDFVPGFGRVVAIGPDWVAIKCASGKLTLRTGAQGP